MQQGEDPTQVLREVNTRLRGSDDFANLRQDSSADSFGLAPISLWREQLELEREILDRLTPPLPADAETTTAESRHEVP